MSHLFRRTLLLVISILLAVQAVKPHPLWAEESDFTDAPEYVEVFDGDMPLLFAVGHGGWKQVGEEKNGGYAADPLLRDYFYQVLAVRIYERTGHLPYVVYQQGNRNYVNTNRPVNSSEAYHPDNTEAREAYFEFHNQVDAIIGRMEEKYGADMALMINPHTTDLNAGVGNRPWDRIADIGFGASVTNLGGSRNTMKALYDRKGEAAMRGEDSIPYQLYHGQDWPTSDAVWPEVATTNSKTLAQNGKDVWHVLPALVDGDWVTAYYNGYSTIQYHGTNTSGHHTNWSNGLDAFQMEINYTKNAGIALDQSGGYQLDVPFTTALMDDLIDATLHSLEVNYNWTPGSAYNVIVDNGDAGFDTSGTWEESVGQGFWNTPSIYTEEAGGTATWAPTLGQGGTYEVFVRWTESVSRTYDAQYTVNYAGGSQDFVIDQGGDQDARWVSLGQFPFDAGNGGSVVLESTGTGTTAADATLFRLISGDGHQAPTASFIAKPTMGLAPLEVTFDASGSTDPDGTIESYAWDFDDKSTAEGISVTHTFTPSGRYDVRLVVTDNNGATDVDTQTINVVSEKSYEFIVDNMDAGFSATGDWQESGEAQEYNGSSLYAIQDGSTATWTPDLPAAGTYAVFAWWVYYAERAENAPYTISHANGSHTVRVNQRQNAGQWMLLGVYPFDAGVTGTQGVTLKRESGDGSSTSADAVRFLKVQSLFLPLVLTSN